MVERPLGGFPASRLRSYAITRCVVDLGLRSSEVIKLELDDIDWAAGTLRIEGAGRQAGQTPTSQGPDGILLAL